MEKQVKLHHLNLVKEYYDNLFLGIFVYTILKLDWLDLIICKQGGALASNLNTSNYLVIFLH